MEKKLMVYTARLTEALTAREAQRFREMAETLKSTVDDLCNDLMNALGERMAGREGVNLSVEQCAGCYLYGVPPEVARLVDECDVKAAVPLVLGAKWDASPYGSSEFGDVDAKPFPFETLSDVFSVDQSVHCDDDDVGRERCHVLIRVSVDLYRLVYDVCGHGDTQSAAVEAAAAGFRGWAESYQGDDRSPKKQRRD